jgi:hypothetical protein
MVMSFGGPPAAKPFLYPLKLPHITEGLDRQFRERPRRPCPT